MKNKLIASAPSVEELLKMIAKYFCGVPNDYVIYEVVSKGVYNGTVYKKATGEKLSSYVVKRKKDRYRFELVTV